MNERKCKSKAHFFLKVVAGNKEIFEPDSRSEKLVALYLTYVVKDHDNKKLNCSRMV